MSDRAGQSLRPSSRNAVVGVSQKWRKTRVRILQRLFLLFEGHNAADEIRRLKTQDEGF